MSEAKWMLIELMGHKNHVGKVSEETIYGQPQIRVEAIQRDGAFVAHHYGDNALYHQTEITEEQARRAVLPMSWRACDIFKASVVLPERCEDCGFTAKEHEEQAAKALPSHEDADFEELP